METADESPADTPPARKTGPARAHRNSTRRGELLALLMQKKVPEKDDIIRVKKLVRALACDDVRDGSHPVVPEEFISAYLDLYLGRVIGDASIEKAGLRRCVSCLCAPPQRA